MYVMIEDIGRCGVGESGMRLPSLADDYLEILVKIQLPLKIFLVLFTTVT